ncbi:hypothetical protein PACTADRAFT_5343, partial [Pachysolen tannophilus NRRL Y-2460]
QLGAKMEDLLDNLPSEAANNNFNVDNNNNHSSGNDRPRYVQEKKQLNHAPNPHKSLRGARKVEQIEKQRFAAVFTDKNYQQSPFEALRQSMENNL